ncbi:hypothetical protein L596_009770 [Steinernema carpocapsae]|uniref:Uncharacterized protein n=1 Tax=Steinernema carpocapsae TaxID=34508 RepID=A0A4U5PGA6_STECR|nr:hypothetical protein L596_009770 [Steinernema carpocapsae]
MSVDRTTSCVYETSFWLECKQQCRRSHWVKRAKQICVSFAARKRHSTFESNETAEVTENHFMTIVFAL